MSLLGAIARERSVILYEAATTCSLYDHAFYYLAMQTPFALLGKQMEHQREVLENH